MFRKLEDAVSLGLPVLLENIGAAVDSYLDPLLNDEAYRQGQSWVIGTSALRHHCYHHDSTIFFYCRKSGWGVKQLTSIQNSACFC